METQRLLVTGMTCQGCVESVARALRAIGGVENADVSLASGSATIQFDEHQTSVDELEQAVQRAGYDVSNGESSESLQGNRKGCCCG
jgi:copper ion binding protein